MKRAQNGSIAATLKLWSGFLCCAVASGCTMQVSLESTLPWLKSRPSKETAQTQTQPQPNAVAQVHEYLDPLGPGESPSAAQPASQSQEVAWGSPVGRANDRGSGASAAMAPVINAFGEFNSPDRGRQVDPRFRQQTFTEDGYDADVCVDPSGKYLLFASTRNSEHASLWRQNLQDRGVTQLTSEPADDAQPAFSADGKRIAFCSNRSGAWDIYIMDADGKNVERVTDGSKQCMHPSFSPDGKRLVYSALSGQDQWELWIVSLTTHQAINIGPGLFPSWSPRKDLDRIAFQKSRHRGSRWFSLWTVDVADGKPRCVTEVAVSDNSAIVSPCWSPDGQSLAFATIFEPAVMHDGKPRGQHDIWVIDGDGTHRRRLTDGHGTNLTPCWAVDNRVYFISDRGRMENVWSAPVEEQSRPDARKHQPPAGPAQQPRMTASAAGSPDAARPNGKASLGQADAREMDP